METVTKVKVLRPYILEVTFSDGFCKQIDLAEELYGEVFEPLRDARMFARVAVDEVLGTLVWPNGADLSPEFLYNWRSQGFRDSYWRRLGAPNPALGAPPRGLR